MTLAPELLLADRYRLVERIASGGMGEVWRAVDTILGRQVAVKALRAELADDPEFLSRFRAEARHTASLLHPGIANVYDYGEVGDGQGRSGATTAYLVMELVDGEPLSTVLAREGRLDPPRALDVCAQAALALDAAHQVGVIHRDVKPGNLLVRADGVVKVTDFGIARAVDAAPTTATGTVLGTAYYLSPEQAGGARVGPASDIYALGVVAYECLSGRRPFPGSTPIAVALAHQRDPVPELPAEIPLSVRRAVMHALEKDPAQRPASAGEFAHDLRRIAAAEYGGATGTQTVVLPPAVARATGPDATRVLPPAPSPTAQTHRAAPPPPVRRDPEPTRSPARTAAPLVLGIILALVVASALLLRNLADEPPAQVAVPDVVGTSLAAATQALEAEGLEVTVERVETREEEPDTVLDQAPAAGESADAGSTVTLDVAEEPAGPETVTVDRSDFLGRPFDEVESALQADGLRVRRTNTGSGEEPGTVSDVDPSGEVEVGSVVTVFVVPEPAGPSPTAGPPASPSAPPSGEGGGTGSGGTGGEGEPDGGTDGGNGNNGNGNGNSNSGNGNGNGNGGNSGGRNAAASAGSQGTGRR